MKALLIVVFSIMPQATYIGDPYPQSVHVIGCDTVEQCQNIKKSIEEKFPTGQEEIVTAQCKIISVEK